MLWSLIAWENWGLKGKLWPYSGVPSHCRQFEEEQQVGGSGVQILLYTVCMWWQWWEKLVKGSSSHAGDARKYQMSFKVNVLLSSFGGTVFNCKAEERLDKSSGTELTELVEALNQQVSKIMMICFFLHLHKVQMYVWCARFWAKCLCESRRVAETPCNELLSDRGLQPAFWRGASTLRRGRLSSSEQQPAVAP